MMLQVDQLDLFSWNTVAAGVLSQPGGKVPGMEIGAQIANQKMIRKKESDGRLYPHTQVSCVSVCVCVCVCVHFVVHVTV